MTSIIESQLLQAGAFGVIIIGLFYFSRYMFVKTMKQMEALINDNKNLEKEFREHLLDNSREHHEIIKNNTEAFKELIDVIAAVKGKV